MAQSEPKPLLVRMFLFVLAGYCGLAIVTVALFLPLLLVANFGGGPSGSVGWSELLQGLGVLAAGLGLPSLVFAKGARTWRFAVPVIVVLIAALVWPFASQDPDAVFVVVLIGLALLHGLAMFWAFGQLSGRSAPPEWKGMP